jgi:hypothetical protein
LDLLKARWIGAWRALWRQRAAANPSEYNALVAEVPALEGTELKSKSRSARHATLAYTQLSFS